MNDDFTELKRLFEALRDDLIERRIKEIAQEIGKPMEEAREYIEGRDFREFYTSRAIAMLLSGYSVASAKEILTNAIPAVYQISTVGGD